MADDRIVQQVMGILAMNDINYMTNEAQSVFLVPAGSAGIFVSFSEWRDGTVITLRAKVLENVDKSDERRAVMMAALNEMNGSVPFGCFHYDEGEGVVELDYQLLGDHLQAEEFMNALGVIAGTADDIDDRLRDLIGSGVRAQDAWERAKEGSTEGGAGPVVSA